MHSQSWEDPSFLAEAREWIDGELDAAGLAVTGEVAQPHVRPWSTVLRVPTEMGDVWFKAAVPSLSHDIGVTVTLSRLRPDLVLAPLAVDLERRWMLLPDGGERLREVLARDRRPDRWLDLAPLYAELQIAATEAVPELLDADTPDYRLARLPDLSVQLAASLEVPGPDPPSLAALAAELADLGIPETIQHDDLHEANVFVDRVGYRFFDWGDSCISHPFLSLTVLLRGVAHAFELDENDSDLERIRDAYLEPWSDRGSRTELLRAGQVASRLGMLTRALAWWRWAAEAGDARRPPEEALAWLEEFAAS